MSTIKEPMHPDFVGILKRYIKQYGEKDGTSFFYAWLKKHNLDDTKAYSVQAQLGECKGLMCESYSWMDEPLIQFYKEDKGGRYYKCVALTANVSMNMNDYSDKIEFSQAAGSLSHRQLNLNHDHNKRLPFPENRVDYARYEDGRVETVIRIDNSRRDIQRKIENGDILHPSIEGTPRSVKFTDSGRKIGRWNFTELALLERDVTLPGDPLTFIEPVPINESMGRSLVESLSVEKQEDETKLPDEDKDIEIEEDYTGINNIGVCSQCRYYEELSDTTKTSPKATGQPDDATVTVSTGAIGPGVGICRLATRLEGVTKYVKKNDPACTDGRVRDTPTDVDRTIERKNELDEIEKEAIKADYESRLAAKENEVIEEIKKTDAERTEKINLQIQVKEHLNTLKNKEREIASLTSEVARLKEERPKLREEIDNLKEQVASLNIGIAEKDKDIKHYKDRYDAYERTHKEMSNEVLMLKEQLQTAYTRRDEEAAARATATQVATDARREHARVKQENAELYEKLVDAQQQIVDSSRVRSDSAKETLSLQRQVEEMRKERDGLVEEVRDLKQKLSKTPKTYNIKI